MEKNYTGDIRINSIERRNVRNLIWAKFEAERLGAEIGRLANIFVSGQPIKRKEADSLVNQIVYFSGLLKKPRRKSKVDFKAILKGFGDDRN
jgi:hypothetical protein